MLLVAGVAILVTVAAADVIRRGFDDESAPPPATTTERVLEGFPQHVFSGRLVYADELCDVNGVDLATGAELPLPASDIQSCRGLWAPMSGELIVVGLLNGDGEDVSLMLRKGDTGENAADRPIAAALPESVVTGQGGEIGWCDRRGRGGVIRSPENEVQRVRGCPAGFLPDGHVIALRGQKLFVGDELVRTLAPNTFVVGVSEHRKLAVFQGGTLSVFPALSNPDPSITVELPDIAGRPLLAPDGCAILYPAFDGERATVRLRTLGCGLATDRDFEVRGSGWRDGEATWSPDGTWIAISGPDDSVRLYRSDGGGDPVDLRVPAEYLAWTG